MPNIYKNECMVEECATRSFLYVVIDDGDYIYTISYKKQTDIASNCAHIILWFLFPASTKYAKIIRCTSEIMI